MHTRILIVEDEAITALDLKRELIALGYEVVGTADNARDAVKLAATTKPSVVLMDICLADNEDGIVAASVIRAEDNVPVIFLTAHSDQATLERALNASPFGYILKPFQIREVRVCIEVALYKHQKEDEVRQLVVELTAALERVKVLTGLLPICASCKKIRGDDQQWHHLETYLESHSEVRFSHGVCPDCRETLYAKPKPTP